MPVRPRWPGHERGRFGAVNSDGWRATYAFELGVYNGASTPYGAVFSGSADKDAALIPEPLQLSGLRPGTTYAYGIAINAATAKRKAPMTFTTAGRPSGVDNAENMPTSK